MKFPRFHALVTSAHPVKKAKAVGAYAHFANLFVLAATAAHESFTLIGLAAGAAALGEFGVLLAAFVSQEIEAA